MTAKPALSKVPLQITALFWIAKLLSTAMGEATSDYLVKVLNPVPAGVVGTVLVVVVLVVQFRTPRYTAWAYWSAVSAVAVFGTMLADGLHVELGVPYPASMTFYGVLLAVVFITWSRREHTLSIHTITDRRREAFYWLTVIATFALGTAAGDFMATTLHLGYLTATIVFGLAMLVPALGYRWFRFNRVFAFWFAYVLTRPFGASIADWLSKNFNSGLGWGDGTVALLMLGLLVVVVSVLAVTKLDLRPSGRPAVNGSAEPAAG